MSFIRFADGRVQLVPINKKIVFFFILLFDFPLSLERHIHRYTFDDYNLVPCYTYRLHYIRMVVLSHHGSRISEIIWKFQKIDF